MALVEFRKFIVDYEVHSERQLLLLILHRQEQIMGDTTALAAAVAQLKVDVAALLAAQVPPVDDQPAIDAATTDVQAVDATVVAATPAAPAPPAAPAE